MSIESDMRAAFLANANVAALVVDRFYPLQAPQGVSLPTIVYQHNSGDGERTLGGVFVQQEARYTLRLVTADYSTIVQLKVACLELAGSNYGVISDFDITEGGDGFDFDTERYIKVINVLCLM
jgi:hypothetical protein